MYQLPILIRQQLDKILHISKLVYVHVYIHHRTKQTPLIDQLTGAGPLIDEGTSFNIFHDISFYCR